MPGYSRRNFLRYGSLGLAATGAATLTLCEDAQETPSSGDLGDYGKYLNTKGTPSDRHKGKGAPTEDNILGPFYREGSPFRAKVTPPLESGVVLLIRGRVWSF